MDNYSKMLIESSLGTISYYREASELYHTYDELDEAVDTSAKLDSIARKKANVAGQMGDVEKQKTYQNLANKAFQRSYKSFSQDDRGKGNKAAKRLAVMRSQQNESYFIEMLSILEEAGYLESEEDFLGLAEAAIDIYNKK